MVSSMDPVIRIQTLESTYHILVIRERRAFPASITLKVGGPLEKGNDLGEKQLAY